MRREPATPVALHDRIMQPDLDSTPDARRARLIRAAAYHEAGHAVVAWYFGKHFAAGGVAVSFTRPGEGGTYTHGSVVLPLARLPESLRKPALRRLRAECLEFLAGYLAERRALGGRGPVAQGSDAHRAVLLIIRAHACIQAIAELHLQAHARSARRLVRRPVIWSAIDRLALRLIRQGRVTPAELEQLCSETGLRRVQPSCFVVPR